MASQCAFVCCPICTWSASSSAATIEQTSAAIRQTVIRHLLGDHGLPPPVAERTAAALAGRLAWTGPI